MDLLVERSNTLGKPGQRERLGTVRKHKIIVNNYFKKCKKNSADKKIVSRRQGGEVVTPSGWRTVRGPPNLPSKHICSQFFVQKNCKKNIKKKI